MRYINPVSLSLHDEKSNFFSFDGFYGSEIIFAKYANTSSPKKFLLHTSVYILEYGNISQSA
jgi:hypothetical protein